MLPVVLQAESLSEVRVTFVPVVVWKVKIESASVVAGLLEKEEEEDEPGMG